MAGRGAGAAAALDAQGPYQKAVAVTPADGADVVTGQISDALYIGTGGALSVVMAGDGQQVVFAAVAAGLLPIQVTRVRATGTVASGIVFLYS